jgi:hypothetical protein
MIRDKGGTIAKDSMLFVVQWRMLWTVDKSKGLLVHMYSERR